MEDLGKRKVASRFVPHALSDDQRQYAKDIIKTAHRNKNILNSIVAEDETWCFRYDPTTKCQIAEWKSPASPKRKKSLCSKVKSEDNACVILRQQGNYSPYYSPLIIHQLLSLRNKLSREIFISVFWNAYG